MSTAHIILICTGAVVGIGVLGFTAFAIRTISTTRKRIPLDTGGPLEVVVKDSKMIARGFKRTEEMISGREWPVITRLWPEGRHGVEMVSPPAQVEAESDRAFTFISDCLTG